jgi:MFS family permease
MLADRFGSFGILIAGLLLGSLAFAAVALVHSYWFLLAMFALAGLANTVYHPANYSLLSHHVASKRMGSAFSIHTFAGMLGDAIAPYAAGCVRNSVRVRDYRLQYLRRRVSRVRCTA